MNEKQLIYLAVPFSHPDPMVQKERFHRVNKAAAKLLSRGQFVFSPISHSYPIAQDGTLEGDWDFWKSYCRTMVSRCDVLYVLTLHGWKDSVGVQSEIEIAKVFDIPIYLIDENLVCGWFDSSTSHVTSVDDFGDFRIGKITDDF